MTATPGKSNSDEKRLQAIGAQIARIRKKLGIRQKDLGEKIGVHEQTMTRYESGDGGAFSILTAIAMADALGVSLDQLVGRRDAPASVPLARDATLWFQRPKVLAALREAKRTGKWNEVQKYFGVGFGFGIVLDPEDVQVPEEQYMADLALVIDATEKVGLRRLRRWFEEENRGHPRSRNR